MDKWQFGLTLLVVGVAGTFITLWIISLATALLKRAFPISAGDGGTRKDA